MTKPVTFKLKNADEISRAFRKAPKLAEKVFRKALKGSQLILEKNNLKDDPTPFDTGALLNSFNFRSGDERAVYFPTAKYAKYVHEGTDPHPVSIEEIRGWANRHNIEPAAVQEKIETEGTEANPFLEKLLEKTEPKLIDLFGDALDKFNKDLSNRIE